MVSLDTIFAVIGCILSNALYFNTVPKMLSIFREKSLDNFNPLPIVVMVLNATAWVLYGVHVPDYAIVASNIFGGILCFVYVMKLFPLIENENDVRMCQITLLVGVTLLLGEQAFLRFYEIDIKTTLFVEGLTATGYCVAMFASPLSQIKKVITIGDASSIYCPLTAVQCTNCLTWTIYGFFVDDVWVYGPNLAGLVLGFAQVLLLVLFGSRPSMLPLTMPDSPGAVQLSRI